MAPFDLTILKTITILYVEDEQMIAEQSLKIYNKLFKNVFWAKDGDEALNIFKEHTQDIDVIITDINMPNLSGINLAKKVLEIKKVPIIVTTAYTDTQYMLDAIDLGVNKYATKPININNILQDIQKAVTQYREEANIKTIAKDLLIKSKSTSEDITKLTKENEELKKSIMLYEALIDKYMMTIQTDKNGNIVQLSNKFAKLLGYKSDELIGKNISTLKDPSCTEKPFQKQMLEAIHKKTQIQSQHILKSKSGKPIKFDVYMDLFYGTDLLVSGYKFYLNLVIN